MFLTKTVVQWLDRGCEPTDVRRRVIAAASLLPLVFSICSTSNEVSAAAPTQFWVAQSPGGSGVATGQPACGDTTAGKRSMAIDASGNVYVTGCSPNGANNDYLTVKYDSSGTVLWQARYNGTGNGEDAAKALALDSSGNVYVTGQSVGSTGGYNYATVKYNSSGTQQWAEIYNGAGNSHDLARGLVVDGSGNVYVTGQSVGSTGGYNYATVKYNSSGVQQWATEYNGTADNTDTPNDLAVDGSGNVYVTGGSVGSTGGNNYATVKYDSSGVQQWVAIYNGTGNSNDLARGLVVDGSGNVYVTGVAAGSTGSNNYATVKYNNSGVQQWVSIYNGTGNFADEAYALAVDSSGNVYVTGRSLGSSGGDNYATVKYNSSGVQQWASIYNGTGNTIDQAYSVAVDGGGNVYATGSSSGSTGGVNYATVKYNSSGVQQWATEYSGVGTVNDVAYAVAVDGSANVYVTGYSQGNTGGNKYLTAKYNSSGVQQWTAGTTAESGFAEGLGSSNGVFAKRAMATDAGGNVFLTGSLFNGLNWDYQTVMFNSAGVQQWAAQYNGSNNGDDYAHAIAVDINGNVYVTGQAAGGPGGYEYATVKYNSSGVQQWVAIYNGTGSSSPDYGTALAVDGSGNVYVTGYSSNGSNLDYATIKYNSGGVQQWASIYNGTGNGDDWGRALAVDGSGNVYVTGQSVGSTGSWNYATVKYNSSGVQQWASIYNGTGNGDDYANGLVVDGSGNVYVTGQSVGSTGSWNYATVKYNSSGVQQWASEYNGTGNGPDLAWALAADGIGNVYVTGQSAGSTGNYNYATVKYNSSGVQQWASTYNGTANLDDLANALVLDSSGNVYVAGMSIGSIGSTNFVTVKYNGSGVEQWVHSYDGSRNAIDQGFAVSLSADGGILVAGTESLYTGYGRMTAIKLAELQATTAAIGVHTPSPSIVGESYAVNFNVTSAGDIPTGTVTVSDDQGASCGPISLVSGAGACNLASTVAGGRTLTATYTPASLAFATSSGTATHSVNRSATSLTITGHIPEPSIPGAATTVTVVLAATPPGAGVPTGNVVVSSGNGDTCTIAWPGATSCALTLSAPGPWTLGASYAGDTNFDSSSATSVGHAITAYTLTYTANSNGSIGGPTPQTVNHGSNGSAVTAVADSGYHFTQWSDTSVANPRADSNVTASLAVAASFAINQYTVSSTGSGLGGSITPPSQTVNHGSTTTFSVVPTAGYTASASGCSGSLVGTTFTTGTITGACTVTAVFTLNQYTLTYTADANGSISGTTPQTVNFGSNGSAVSAVPNGGFYFAQWSDSSTANPRTDSNVTTNITVAASFAAKGVTSTSIGTVTPASSVYGQSVDVTALVTGGINPTGTVTVTAIPDLGGTPQQCSNTLSAGAITCTLPPLGEPGPYTLAAVYAGDANDSASSSAMVAYQVTTIPTAVTIVSHMPDPSLIGWGVVVRVKVDAVSPPPSVGEPGGSVMVSASGTESCTIASLIAIAGSSFGNCVLTLTTAGARTLTVSYPGDTHFAANSNSAAHTVNLGATTTTINSVMPGPSSTFGQSITVSAAVSGGIDPTGTVTISATPGGANCSAPLSGGSASCGLNTGNVGNYTLTASYGGDGDDAASVSVGVAHTVVKATQTVNFSAQSPAFRALVMGGSFPINPLAVAGASSSAVIYSVAPSGVCTVAGTTVTMVGLGSCAITASQLGDSNYEDATPVTQSVALVATLDVDHSESGSQYHALTDGLLIVRYLAGVTGDALTLHALGSTASRTDAAIIETYLDAIRPLLDVDANGSVDASIDGVLIVRYLLGLRGAALIAGVAPTAVAAEVEARVLALMP